MILYSSRIGVLLDMFEKRMTYKEVDEMIRPSSKKVHEVEMNGAVSANYTIRGGLFGPKEVVVVAHRGGRVITIAVVSIDSAEYAETYERVKTSFEMYPYIGRQQNMDFFQVAGTDVLIMFGVGTHGPGQHMIGFGRNGEQ